MYGTVPAFVSSLCSNAFTVQDYCAAVPRPPRLGFRAFQPEIYVAAALPEWLQETGRMQHTETDLGLAPTQFVAHFRLEWFADPDRVGPDRGLDDLKRAVEVIEAFPACRVVNVPAGQFHGDRGSCSADPGAWLDIQRRVIEQIRRYLGGVSKAGLRLAFEIAPFSVIGGIRRFLAICDEIGSPDLDLNFDTDHGWARSCAERGVAATSSWVGLSTGGRGDPRQREGPSRHEFCERGTKES